MRKILQLLTLSLLAQPALAQGLSPIQMYLQGEVGYAPPLAAAPQPQVRAPSPYDVAQSPAAPAPQQTNNYGDNSRINAGLAAMNN